MFKVALFVVLFGVAMAVTDELRWDKIPVAANSSQCIYRVDPGLLSCRGGPKEEVIECSAVLETRGLGSRRCEVFGLRRMEKEADQKIESIKYYLYPREMENTTYLDRVVEVEGQKIELYLYYSDKFVSNGLRVTDLKCYEKLVTGVYEKSTASHEITIGEEKVSLFGEILIADKPAHKRWIGWLSPWSMGWGWGLGWGWPFWGFGLLG